MHTVPHMHHADVAGVCSNFNSALLHGFDNHPWLSGIPSHLFCLPMSRLLTGVQSQAPALLKVAATNSPSLLKVLKWLLVLVSLTGAAVLRRLLVIWFKAWRSPLRALPGPKSKSLFLGNFDLRFDPENALPHEQWISEYGTAFSYAGLLNVSLWVDTTKGVGLIFG
jgi:hypothetical protein